MKTETAHVPTEGGFRLLHTISLGNINPGQELYLENLWCQVWNLNKLTVIATTKSGEEKKVPQKSYRITQSMTVRLSAENAKMERKELSITTGNEEMFKENGMPYFTYSKGAMRFHGKDT